MRYQDGSRMSLFVREIEIRGSAEQEMNRKKNTNHPDESRVLWLHCSIVTEYLFSCHVSIRNFRLANLSMSSIYTYTNWLPVRNTKFIDFFSTRGACANNILVNVWLISVQTREIICLHTCLMQLNVRIYLSWDNYTFFYNLRIAAHLNLIAINARGISIN